MMLLCNTWVLGSRVSARVIRITSSFNLDAVSLLQAIFVRKNTSTHLAKYHSQNSLFGLDHLHWEHENTEHSWNLIFRITVFQVAIDAWFWKPKLTTPLDLQLIFFNFVNTFLVSFLDLWDLQSSETFLVDIQYRSICFKLRFNSSEAA